MVESRSFKSLEVQGLVPVWPSFGWGPNPRRLAQAEVACKRLLREKSVPASTLYGRFIAESINPEPECACNDLRTKIVHEILDVSRTLNDRDWHLRA